MGEFVPSMLKHIDAFIAPSHFVRDQYQASHLAITSLVLPHFFNSSPRQRAATKRDYYLYVGRLERAKGLQTLFRHFRDGLRRLVIAGSGTYEAELKRQGAGNPNVVFLGRVPHSELPRWYADARATIIPSICYETFGLPILESLQQGTPVITSHYGALPEIVGATGGGEVYREPEELEAALARFDHHPEYARQLGERGAAGLGPYSPEAHLREYMNLIERCRNRRTGGFDSNLCESQ